MLPPRTLSLIGLTILLGAILPGSLSAAVSKGEPVRYEAAGDGMVGGVHDFSAEPWNSHAEICRVCHVPHDHGRNLYEAGLLWNHGLSSQTFEMYSSILGPLDGAQEPQPSGVSKLCLGCHDGTVGIDHYDKYETDNFTMDDYNPNNIINANLNRTHPISIAYSLDDPYLNDPATTIMGSSGMIADVLDEGRLECSSCHDVHDQETVTGTPLLRVANWGNYVNVDAASALCFTCHVK
jgi:hypothetical protein